jgi:hypothetical protein
MSVVNVASIQEFVTGVQARNAEATQESLKVVAAMGAGYLVGKSVSKARKAKKRP